MGLVPYKRISSEMASPFHHVRTHQCASYEPGRDSLPHHAGTMILDLEPPEL